MQARIHAPTLTFWAVALTLGLSTGCSGSGASGGTESDLYITSISMEPNANWHINRPIDVRFSQNIDFSTVNFNTFRVVDATGVSASGSFSQPLDEYGNAILDLIRFQPTCPVEDDFADAGLAIDTTYSLQISSIHNAPGGTTIMSLGGSNLSVGTALEFSTPNSTLPAVLFLDTVPGPPRARIRGIGGVPADNLSATYLEVGGDDTNRHYFDSNGLGTFEVPLNLYSDPDSRVELVLYLNQAVLANSNNISSDRISFEFEETAGNWTPIPTTVKLEKNCVLSGAILSVTPLGLLPQGSNLRVAMRQGFVDLTGDPTTQDNTDFAPMLSAVVVDGNGQPTEAADEILEEFVLSGGLSESLEDVSTPLGNPRADWGADGRLEASFAFGGSGGPNGDFDFHVAAGQTISISTTTATIVGGPGGVPTASQTIIGGVLDVRNLVVPLGSRLIFVGPNPVTILASGTVTVEGEISVRGGDNDGVGTLYTTFQPEAGAAGNAGGGKGGTGSYLTASSTPRGGAGYGAFHATGGGGEGGETSYTTSLNKNLRRGAGGGGGGFAPAVFYDHDNDPMTPDRYCQTLIGMDGEDGFAGAAGGLGATSQAIRAQGGHLGPDPFEDNHEDNNFYGTLITSTGELIRGELDHVWAGTGGGGGGDAAQVTNSGYPRIPFQTSGDEKGSGGGGGGGGISILAIGSITVEEEGRIVADGGHGGGGENVLNFDRVGGGSGGGSGGHIVLSSASYIEVKGSANNAGTGYRDANNGHKGRPLSALGGQGGAGHEDDGGANADGVTSWNCDGIELARLNVGGAIGSPDDVPPLNNPSACFGPTGMLDWADPEGPVLGAGGDGAPGMIQMHVDDPASNLRFAGGLNWTNADLTKSSVPTPLGWNGVGIAANNPAAFFGRISVAQSKWIPLGMARIDAAGGPDHQVSFFFGGTDPQTGFVRRNAGGAGPLVDPLPEIIPATPLATTIGALPAVDEGGLTIALDGSSLIQAYRINPNLLKNFEIVMTDAVQTHIFNVAEASWMPGDELELALGGGENFIDDFVNTATGTVSVALRPGFFRISTNGAMNSYAPNTSVRIRFDATTYGTDGLPDEGSSYSALHGAEPTADINDLNGQNWDVLRFKVEFDLSPSGQPVNPLAPRPALEFLRLPFVF